MMENQSNHKENPVPSGIATGKIFMNQVFILPYDCWMMVHAEHDIATNPERTLAEQSPEDVDAHLAELRQELGLKKKCFRAHRRQECRLHQSRQAVGAPKHLIRYSASPPRWH